MPCVTHTEMRCQLNWTHCECDVVTSSNCPMKICQRPKSIIESYFSCTLTLSLSLIFSFSLPTLPFYCVFRIAMEFAHAKTNRQRRPGYAKPTRARCRRLLIGSTTVKVGPFVWETLFVIFAPTRSYTYASNVFTCGLLGCKRTFVPHSNELPPRTGHAHGHTHGTLSNMQ